MCYVFKARLSAVITDVAFSRPLLRMKVFNWRVFTICEIIFWTEESRGEIALERSHVSEMLLKPFSWRIFQSWPGRSGHEQMLHSSLVIHAARLVEPYLPRTRVRFMSDPLPLTILRSVAKSFQLYMFWTLRTAVYNSLEVSGPFYECMINATNLVGNTVVTYALSIYMCVWVVMVLRLNTIFPRRC